MQKDKHLRSITKAISWRFFATMATIVIVYLATGNLTMSFTIGLIEVFSKLALYYLHERAWVKVKWGKEEKSDSSEAENNK